MADLLNKPDAETTQPVERASPLRVIIGYAIEAFIIGQLLLFAASAPPPKHILESLLGFNPMTAAMICYVASLCMRVTGDLSRSRVLTVAGWCCFAFALTPLAVLFLAKNAG